MAETFFAEMKRYVGFGPDDEAALRMFHPLAAPEFRRISDEFYQRLARHPAAASVIAGPEQLARLKRTLCDWMDLLLTGPWDEDYYQRRARIGRVHVKISLPQRYMFGAMNAMRIAFAQHANQVYAPDTRARVAVVTALHKIIDLELAIMLETYQESFVAKVQELERVEKTLLQARYDEIVETGSARVVTFDADGTIRFANRMARDACDEGLVGSSWFERCVAPADRGEVRRACARLLQTGESVPVFETAVAKGSETRRVRWYLSVLPGGDVPSLVAMGIDVTEEYALALRTRRAERLASLGTMAAGLAHEIRNPLNAAHLQLTLLKRRLTRGPEVPAGVTEAAELVASEMKRLGMLVEEFLQFARPQPLRILSADLRSAAETVVSLLAPVAEAATVALALIPGPPLILDLDEEKIKQVIHNLVRNAIEASPAGGRVEVRLGVRGSQAFLEVEDNGAGISPPDSPIFEPFYTSKPQGTGLGLAIVLRIISDHGGRIDVESRPGKTLFTISLPITQITQTLRGT